MMLRMLLLAGLLALAQPAMAASGKLVLYSSQPDRIASETIAAFKTREPNVEIELFRSGTTEILNKLAAEVMAGAPQPDVLLIADAMAMEQLKADHRLMAYPAAKLAGVPPAAYDPDKRYFGTKLITTGIVYNRKAPFKPERWKDLARPEAKAQVVLPSPLYSGAAAINLGALGLDYYAALAGNGAQAVSGNGAVLTAVAGGQKNFGVIVDFMALNAKAQGSPVEFVFPKDGVVAVTEPVAILETAHNPEAAKAFVDFLLSHEGQELAARQGFLPIRADVPPPPGFPADINFLPIDIQRIRKADDQAKQRFADLFGG
ncbi:MAG TPA: ABC transporter substrate-binding protein [Aliidongia sp.]|nr:ABC transporter substrate-binding protein [Aliidongia sp.]